MTTASVNSELASSGESLSATAPADIEKITSVLLPNVGAVGTDQQYVTGLQIRICLTLVLKLQVMTPSPTVNA